jgi:hypothetical protein
MYSEPRDVVHLVRDRPVRAAQKTHAPLRTTVTRGSLWSSETADLAGSIRKGAGSGAGSDLFAKVRVAGSKSVVRSQRTLMGVITSTCALRDVRNRAEGENPELNCGRVRHVRFQGPGKADWPDGR